MAKPSKAKPKTKAVDLDDDPMDDIDAVENDADDGGNEDSVDEPAAPPARTPKMTKTAIAFILLNWIAVPTFLYFAYVDHIARSQYAGQALMNHVRIWGLPLESEEDFPSGSNVTREYLRLTPEQLADAFKKRGGKMEKKDPFVPVEEPVQLRLRPSDLRPSLVLPAPPLLYDIFGKLDDPVPTLEDEMLLQSKKVPKAIEAAAKEVADKLKTEDEKRDLIRKVLLPLAWNVWQIKRTFPDAKAPADLDETISQAKGADLDKLVDESLQRRMYYDILAPINVFRPGDLKVIDPKTDDKKKLQVERIADLEIKLDVIKDHFARRLIKATEKVHDAEFHIGDVYLKERVDATEDRDSIEIRHTIAFILFAVAQATVPTTDKKLFPKGMERAEVVCGLREYSGASIHYVQTLRVLEDRIAESVVANREGRSIVIPGKETRVPTGFIDDYENEVDRLVKLIDYIDAAQKRFDDLKGQREEFEKVRVQRAKQHKDTLEKVVEARKRTLEYAAELRELQDQLHKALVELSDAAERNFALEARIRAIFDDYDSKNKVTPKKKGAQR